MESRSEKARKSKEEDRRLMIKKHFVDKQKKKSSSKSDSKKKSDASKDASDSEDKTDKRPDSPEPHCPICLETMTNKSFTDSCFHTFCFTCLVEWSKVKPECPLCKQQFKSIVHNVQSDFSYDEYHINSRSTNPYNLYPPRFRYPTTMGAASFPFLRRNLESGYTWHSGDNYHNYHSRIEAHRMRNRVYSHGLWVLPTASDRVRTVSPEFYRTNPACTHRLLPWLNRELVALLNNNETQVTFLMELIVALIAKYDITSPEFHIHIEPYLADKTRHFVHEFYHFAASPLEMDAYDRLSNYSGPTDTHHRIHQSHSGIEDQEDDIVIVDDQTAGNSSQAPTELPQTKPLKKIVIKKNSNNDWETVNLPSNSQDPSEPIQLDNPGPSTSSSTIYISHPPDLSPLPDSDGEECQVLEVLKPKRERTPEIVELSSDEEMRHMIYDISSDSDSSDSNNLYEHSPWRMIPRRLLKRRPFYSPASSVSWSTRYPVSTDEFTEFPLQTSPSYSNSSSDIECVYFTEQPSTSTATRNDMETDGNNSLIMTDVLNSSNVQNLNDHEDKKNSTELTVSNVQDLSKKQHKRSSTESTKSHDLIKKESKKKMKLTVQDASKKEPKKKSTKLSVSNGQDLIKQEPKKKKKLSSAIVRPWAMAGSQESSPRLSKSKKINYASQFSGPDSSCVDDEEDSDSRSPKKLKLRSVVAHFSFDSSDKRHDSSRSSHKKHKDKKKKKKKIKHLKPLKHKHRIYSDSDSSDQS